MYAWNFDLNGKCMVIMKLASLFHRYFHHYLYKLKNCKYFHTPSFTDPNHYAKLISQSSSTIAYKSEWNFMNPLDTNSYAYLLQKCTHIKSLEILHTHVIISGLENNHILGAKLVIVYTMFESIEKS